MSRVPPAAAERLGQRLYAERFLPLPEVDNDGNLIGTRLWRQHRDHVEYLALHTSGLGHAVRAAARFSYRSPVEHGPVIEHRLGYAVNALDWLLSTSRMSSAWRPSPPGRHRLHDDGPFP